MSASGTHHPPEFTHAEDMGWEMGRFGNVTKFLFHPPRRRDHTRDARYPELPQHAETSAASCTRSAAPASSSTGP